MILRGVLIILIACGCVEFTAGHKCPPYNKNNTYPCQNVFEVFHSCASVFLEVAMDHANPFTICTNETSYTRYQRTSLYLNMLLTTNDPKNGNATCADEYLNKNQQSVITNILKTTTQIWDSANCDDCYNGSFSEGQQNFSSHMLEIKAMHDNYSYCTGISKDPAVICHNCEHIYMELNKKFDHEKKLRDGKICFDLEDIINKTRQEWSGTFKCCKDKKDSLTAFFSLFSTVMVIAVVFYASVYVAGSRQSDAELLDAQQILRDSTVIPPLRPSSTGASSSSASSSSQRPSRIRKPKQKPRTNLLINEDSDDDEPIIRQEPVSSNLMD